MSVRILKSDVLSKFHHCKIRKVKRNLFGTSSIGVKKSLEIDIKQQQASRRWGFDFKAGYPLVGEASEFNWERIPFKDLVPEMYLITPGAHIRNFHQVSKPTDNELLLDERAAKENTGTLNNNDLLNLNAVDDSPISDSTVTSASPTSSVELLGKRQRKITDFMKKRKCFQQTSSEVMIPEKLTRPSSSNEEVSSHLPGRVIKRKLTRP